MKKILIIIGTRPEAIKMAPVIKGLEVADGFEPIVCVTGQHREMLDQVLSLFQINPLRDLNVMKHSQGLADVSARIIVGASKAIRDFSPDLVMVHGDTATTAMASLAAFYERKPIAHVEAGLRTYNLHSPFPEEMNRQITSRMARFHFSPTTLGRRNLLSENISDDDICVTGNTVIDALTMTLSNVRGDEARSSKIYSNLSKSVGFDLKLKPYVLITGHRRENFGAGFEAICDAISELAAAHDSVEFVYPVHLNPNVMEPVKRKLNNLTNVRLISPQEYEPFCVLLAESKIVLTDSGGIQEEAPSLGRPVLVMRDTTERPEAVSAGTVRLVGTEKDAIVTAVSELLTDETVYERMATSVNPYGDGFATMRILEFLKSKIGAW